MIRGGLVTLYVRDVGEAVRFYVETLGMKLVEERAGGAAVIDAGDGFRLGLEKRSEKGAGAPPVGLHPKLPLKEAIAIFENRGIRFSLEGDRAVFEDPDGNRLYLCQAQ